MFECLSFFFHVASERIRSVRFVLLLFIYFSDPFSDKLANIAECIKNNKCPENESNSFFFCCRSFFFVHSKRLLIHLFFRFLSLCFTICNAHPSNGRRKKKWKEGLKDEHWNQKNWQSVRLCIQQLASFFNVRRQKATCSRCSEKKNADERKFIGKK